MITDSNKLSFISNEGSWHRTNRRNIDLSQLQSPPFPWSISQWVNSMIWTCHVPPLLPLLLKRDLVPAFDICSNTPINRPKEQVRRRSISPAANLWLIPVAAARLGWTPSWAGEGRAGAHRRGPPARNGKSCRMSCRPAPCPVAGRRRAPAAWTASRSSPRTRGSATAASRRRAAPGTASPTQCTPRRSTSHAAPRRRRSGTAASPRSGASRSGVLPPAASCRPRRSGNCTGTFSTANTESKKTNRPMRLTRHTRRGVGGSCWWDRSLGWQRRPSPGGRCQSRWAYRERRHGWTPWWHLLHSRSTPISGLQTVKNVSRASLCSWHIKLVKRWARCDADPHVDWGSTCSCWESSRSTHGIGPKMNASAFKWLTLSDSIKNHSTSIFYLCIQRDRGEKESFIIYTRVDIKIWSLNFKFTLTRYKFIINNNSIYRIIIKS